MSGPFIPCRGEKGKLLAVVEELCERHRRPVCSADLHEFFREHPDRRPCLLKRVGQQLISAAQVNDGAKVVPFLKKIGLFGYKAYYAMEDTPLWRLRFRDFCAEHRALELRRRRIPDHIEVLEDRGRGAFASHAVSGWFAEIDTLALAHSDPSTIRGMFSSSPFFPPRSAWVPPRLSDSSFVNRKEAGGILTFEVNVRRLWDASLSPARHLSELRWPLSTLFPEPTEYLMLRDQLWHFVRGKWPIDGEDGQMHTAFAQCLRYGKPDTE